MFSTWSIIMSQNPWRSPHNVCGPSAFGCRFSSHNPKSTQSSERSSWSQIRIVYLQTAWTSSWLANAICRWLRAQLRPSPPIDLSLTKNTKKKVNKKKVAQQKSSYIRLKLLQLLLSIIGNLQNPRLLCIQQLEKVIAVFFFNWRRSNFRFHFIVSDFLITRDVVAADNRLHTDNARLRTTHDTLLTILLHWLRFWRRNRNFVCFRRRLRGYWVGVARWRNCVAVVMFGLQQNRACAGACKRFLRRVHELELLAELRSTV